MSSILFFILNIVIFLVTILFYYLFDNLIVLSFGQIIVFCISYFIVTNGLKSIFSLQSFFLVGFALFILGRFFSQIFYSENNIYCIEFIFNYCMSNNEIMKLNIILFLTQLCFCLPYIFKEKISNFSVYGYYSPVVIKILTFIQLFLIIYYSYISYKAIVLSISSGYMALFSSQVESYEAPTNTLIYLLIFVIFSILLNTNSKINNRLIKSMFYFFLVLLLLGILTGSRTSFLTALFVLGYYLYKDYEINTFKFVLLIFILLFLIYFINILASLGGGRDFETNPIFIQISDTLFGQGITLMVFETSMHMSNYPLLAYIKTLFPGIQIIYGYFDINSRYLFDFSSYLVYEHNRPMYVEGFGLGWSLLSDFYIFSFGFLPLYLLLIYFFSYFLKISQSLKGNWINGFLFIFATQLFVISRSSISLLIFMVIMYFIITLLFSKIYVSKG